jgi:hypothetical protein
MLILKAASQKESRQSSGDLNFFPEPPHCRFMSNCPPESGEMAEKIEGFGTPGTSQ